jgi:tRNA nucleotidyltransferase (CCA-adding enzyme)
VRRLVAEHMFGIPNPTDAAKARRFLHRHGDELAFDLVAHRYADLRGKKMDTSRVEELEQGLLREQANPHRLADLAVSGDDLIAEGFEPGPDLGRILAALLALVVDDPELNTRDTLLARAEELR